MLTEPLSFYDIAFAIYITASIILLLVIRKYVPRDPEDFDE